MTTLSRRWFCVSALVLTLGCRGKQTQEPTAPADQTYDVRGVIARVSPDASTVEIRHEAIPQFVSASGETVGMPAMTRPFAVGSGVTLTEFAVGDKVGFALEVRWHAPPDLFIRSMQRLPGDTPLSVE